MKDNELRLAAALFLVLTNASKSARVGKRLNKKIQRAFKKNFKESTKELDRDFLNLIVGQADQITKQVRDTMVIGEQGLLGNVPINPGLLLMMVEKKLPGFLAKFGVNKEEADEYSNLFLEHKLTLYTAMYCNRLFELSHMEEEKLKLSKEQIEKHIEEYEVIAKTVREDIRAKQEEIDNYEEDDTTAEEEELDLLNERLEEVEGIIDNFETQLGEVL